jgi:hypothetical protein
VHLRDLKRFKKDFVFLPNVNAFPGVGESEEMRVSWCPCEVRESEIRKAAIDAPPV